MKKSNLLKILSLTMMLAFIGSVSMNAQGGKANFSGTWTYNAEKSTPPPTAPAGGGGGGGQRMGGGGNFVATQDATSLTRETSRTGQDGTVTKRTTVYVLDGKENTLAAPAGGGGNAAPGKYVATWSADGKNLTIVTERTFNETTTKTTEVWTLTAPKALSIVTTRPGRDGAMTTTTAVYEIK
jgi:hypothetical protein